MIWDLYQRPAHPASGMDPQKEDPWMAARPEEPPAEDNRSTATRRTTRSTTCSIPRRRPISRTAESGNPRGHLEVERVLQGEDREPGARGAEQQNGDQQECDRAAKADKELDIAKSEAKDLGGLVTKLQRTLDWLEGLGCATSDRPPL